MARHDTESTHRARVVMLLTQTLGVGVAAGLVDNAITEAGFDRRNLRYDEAMGILDLLASKSGLVALAAQLAKAQLRAQRLRRDVSDKNDKNGP